MSLTAETNRVKSLCGSMVKIDNAIDIIFIYATRQMEQNHNIVCFTGAYYD